MNSEMFSKPFFKNIKNLNSYLQITVLVLLQAVRLSYGIPSSYN